MITMRYQKLEGKTAIVTGAADGNGLGAARVMGRHGARVILADIQGKVLETAGLLREEGIDASAYTLDITDRKRVDEVFEEVAAKYGIDILVNNAGVCNLVGFLDMSDEVRDRMFRVNILGTWNCTRAAVLHMKEKRYGRIVNISSVTGPVVIDFGDTAYGATKGAVSAFTRAIAIEFAQYGITCNAVLPGYILTPMVRLGASETNPGDPDSVIANIAKTVPLGRLGTIEELGELVAFLASDEASYLTGTQIVIDGGSTLPETSGAMGVS